jgi:hypothetical protein
MMRIIFALLAGTVFFGDATTALGEPAFHPKNTLEGQHAEHYFPDSEFPDADSQSVLIKGFNDAFEESDEPALYDATRAEYVVRVLWLTAFFGTGVLRIEEERDGSVVYWYKRRPTMAALDTKVAFTRRGKLTLAEFARIKSAVEENDFFGLDNRDTTSGSDGTTWLLEVYDRGRYHAVYKSGKIQSPVRTIATVAAQFAGVDTTKLE